MAVTTTTNRVSYTGNATTTVFAYPFRILSSDHLLVYLAGVLQGSGYSVSGVGVPSGGNVTFTSAPGTGVSVVIRRVVPENQLVDTVNQETIYEDVIDTALDKLTMIDQQQSDRLNRALLLSDTDTSTVGFIPDLATRAGKLLGFDGSGNPVTATVIPDDILTAASTATAAAATATAAAATATAASGSATAAAALATPSIENFNGNGSATAFTLASTIAENNTNVFIDGVYQQKAAYSISGTTLTFTAAPPTGTGNIEVVRAASYVLAQFPDPFLPAISGNDLGSASLRWEFWSTNIDYSGAISRSGTQILGDRQIGWGAPTGTATRTTFATSTVTLEQLAQRVKGLIDDLTTHGVIGA